MKKIIILLLFATSLTTTYAQVGFRATYNNVTASGWEKAIEDNFGQSDFNFNHLDVGVDYWFRLKNQRIEFMPTLHFATSTTEIPVIGDGSSRGFDQRAIGLQVNTHIYFLDFKGDCDCPTWSKSEPWVEKGLFLFVSPGVDYQLFDYFVLNSAVETNFKSTDLNFNIGIGLGLDIGISDLITVTPYAGVRFHDKVDWDGFLFDFELPNGLASNMRQIYGGIRLGIRLDE